MSTYHTVEQGECINSIAYNYGFFHKTVWDHPENSELKKKRKHGDILLPGDVVFIPDLTLRQESGSDQQRHRFKRRGVPALLRITFSRRVEPKPDANPPPGKPYNPSAFENTPRTEPRPEYEVLKNAPYVLNIDGILTQGSSDGQGMVKCEIRPNARSASVTFYKGTDKQVSYDLDLGHLDCIETIPGQRKRLNNLGYHCCVEGDEPDDEFQEQMKRFQQDNGFQPTGQADQATKDKLAELHGS